MHVIFRESHGLEETATPTDLGQSPADLVVLSFSDSDLGAFAAGWHAARAEGLALPGLRLANLAALRHPLSIDTYLEATLAQARGILVRLIGGVPYWAYGVEQLGALARRKGIALAFLPADGRPDPRLQAASTLPLSTLHQLARLCDSGGAGAARAALAQLALAAGLYAPPQRGQRAMAPVGAWLAGRGANGLGPERGPERGPEQGLGSGLGAVHALAGGGLACPAAFDLAATRPRVLIVFYRAYAAAADLAPIARLAEALDALGHDVLGLFAPSLKAPDAAGWIARWVARLRPVAIVNATAFSARGSAASPAGPSWAPGSGQPLAAPVSLPLPLPASVRATVPASVPVSPLVSPPASPPVSLFMSAPVTVPTPAGTSVPAPMREGLPKAEPGGVPVREDVTERVPERAPGGVPSGLPLPGGELSGEADTAACRAPEDACATPRAGVTRAGGDHAADAALTPLDVAGVPIFQIALATSDEAAWKGALRGLSPADLAMHVVLPEVDGRLFAGVASFKSFARRDPELQFSRAEHAPHPGRIAAIAARIDAWVRLGATPPDERRLAVVLSSYPGKAWQMAHAVGLDALASAEAILTDLGQPGPPGGLARALAAGRLMWPLTEYRAALARLPEALRDDLAAAWGAPEDDPAVSDGAFGFAAIACGKTLIALQPERAQPASRADDYHDLTRCPRHGYVAFYLWLAARGTDALVHLGAHGTLEWLPGKAVALSETCWPEALVGAMPVIYPFIVNDPGEAAQAKRRIGAVTLGHAPPALREAGGGAGLGRLEALLDEFSNADGLDPARRTRLMGDITAEAQGLGLEAELRLAPDLGATERIARIDRFVCDIKDSQFGDGLHVWARSGPSAPAEAAGLAAALAGRRVPPGPAGSPHRGRTDVLPTGRNLYTIDPRAVPTASAHAQGVRQADELIRRHLQDHGDWPRGLIVDLWGSASIRTAGEEFAMALHLIGARPQWDAGTGRVRGVEIVPLAELDRPRIDVALRVSGLFRDVFPTLAQMFAQAVRALAARDEAPDWNPYAGRAPAARVYGPAPGSYGMGMGGAVEDFTDAGRTAAGEAWLAASAHALDSGEAVADPEGIRALVAGADAFVHLQDLPETDLLLAIDYATHEAGFAAAKAVAGGGTAALWHLDATDPTRPRARSLPEEIARVVRARAANPAWIGGMMRHGFRGAAELAATLEHMAAFAHLAGAVPAHLFDLYHDATLGQAEVRAFIARENPEALRAMEDRLRALADAGLWVSRRNSILAGLGGAAR